MPTPEEIAAAEASQEEAAEAAAVDGKEAEAEEAAEEESAEPEVKTPSETEGLKNALEKLEARLTPQLTAAQREEQIVQLEKETGFNRKQLAFMQKQSENTQLQAGLQYGKDSGKSKIGKILGKLSDKLSAQVEAEMAKLDPRVQADPAAWENMAYLVKGKNAEAYQSSGDEEEAEEPVKKAIGGGMKGLTTNKKSGAADKGGSKKSYDADETTIINQYFAGDAAAYETSKGEKRVGLPRKGDGSGGTNVADRELARMTGGQLG